jgi:hypothetical protein
MPDILDEVGDDPEVVKAQEKEYKKVSALVLAVDTNSSPVLYASLAFLCSVSS